MFEYFDIHFENYYLVLKELKNIFIVVEIDKLFPYENDSDYDSDSSLVEVNFNSPKDLE
tara:strand:- start:63 stop:239 length:177 start_codon:yes stop_codon:yes gene_type:complete